MYKYFSGALDYSVPIHEYDFIVKKLAGTEESVVYKVLGVELNKSVKEMKNLRTEGVAFSVIGFVVPDSNLVNTYEEMSALVQSLRENGKDYTTEWLYLSDMVDDRNYTHIGKVGFEEPLKENLKIGDVVFLAMCTSTSGLYGYGTINSPCESWWPVRAIVSEKKDLTVVLDGGVNTDIIFKVPWCELEDYNVPLFIKGGDDGCYYDCLKECQYRIKVGTKP